MNIEEEFRKWLDGLGKLALIEFTTLSADSSKERVVAHILKDPEARKIAEESWRIELEAKALKPWHVTHARENPGHETVTSLSHPGWCRHCADVSPAVRLIGGLIR